MLPWCQNFTGGFSQCNKARKINERLERKKQYCFYMQMTLLSTILKTVQKKTMELTKDFSRAVGYEVNIHISVTFLNTSNE